MFCLQSKMSPAQILQKNGHPAKAQISMRILAVWSGLVGCSIKPRHKKTCLRDFRPGKTQTGCSTTQMSESHDIADKETRHIILSRQRTTKALIRLRGCADWSAPLLFAYGLNRFSRDVTQLVDKDPMLPHDHNCKDMQADLCLCWGHSSLSFFFSVCLLKCTVSLYSISSFLTEQITTSTYK